ncbi:MAG: hypothetical protein AAF689_16700 [Pseudomonadota bacterium]
MREPKLRCVMSEDAVLANGCLTLAGANSVDARRGVASCSKRKLVQATPVVSV